MKPRILCVDDEPAVLEALQRNFRREFDVSLETSGAKALELMKSSEPFAVVVSDMRMAGMDGAKFLSKAREVSPDTVRMLLTGQTALSSAIAAVNEGHVFRFLTKPCSLETMLSALQAGVRQYELVRSERVLLEQTLTGSVQALSQVLAVVSPESFGRASRVRDLARELAERTSTKEVWSLEVAAMLSELGCIVLPPEVAAKAHRRQALSPEEAGMVERTPAVLERLLSGIPRLDSVRAALRYQDRGFDGGGPPDDAVSGNDLPPHARILKIARDFDAAFSSHGSASEALGTLRENAAAYDPSLLEALTQLKGASPEGRERQLSLSELQPGMKLLREVKSAAGIVLVARGQTVTLEVIERLKNLSQRLTIVEPIACLVA